MPSSKVSRAYTTPENCEGVPPALGVHMDLVYLAKVLNCEDILDIPMAKVRSQAMLDRGVCEEHKLSRCAEYGNLVGFYTY